MSDQYATVDARDVGAFIPADLDDRGLDPYTFRVYCRLCRRAGVGCAYESVPNMAAACKMSERMVQRALKTLLDMNLIDARSASGKPTVYRLLSPKPKVMDDPRTTVTPAPQSPHPRTTVTPTPAPQSPKGSPLEGSPIKGRGASRFTPPDLEEVQAYAIARGVPVAQATRFFDRNEAGGWMVGRNKMKDWRAAFRTWEANWKEWNPTLKVEEGGQSRVTGVKVPS